VHLIVSRDEQVISDVLIDPSYAAFEANGPGCGPTCQQASEVVELRSD
jgi:hypothetical protein